MRTRFTGKHVTPLDFGRRRGVALMVVLGLLALLVVFSVTVEGSLHTTIRQQRLQWDQEQLAKATHAIVAQVLAEAPEQVGTMTVLGRNGRKAHIRRNLLKPNHPVWQEVPGLQLVQSDRMLEIHWLGVTGAGVQARYIINKQNSRVRVIELSTTANRSLPLMPSTTAQ